MSVGATDNLLQGAIRDLERLGQRARMLIIARRVVGLMAACAGVSAVAIGLDWLFRFPAPFRMIVLAIGAIVAVAAAIRLLAPALRFRPTPTQLALRIERSAPALRGRLASGVEFALSGADRESALAARSVQDLASRLSGESIGTWLAPRRSLAEMSSALLTMLAVALLALAFPTHARIGTTRLFAPFSSAEWPARTGVESLAGGRTHHPKGQSLLLAAKLTRGDAPDERVTADVRVERDDGSVMNERMVLTRQPDGRYERVMEGDAGIARVDVRFMSSDDESPTDVITMVPPPSVVSSILTVLPPPYLRDALGEPSAEVSIDLGDGTDERSTLRDPALVGSSAELALTMSKPLPPHGDQAAWSAHMLDGRSDDSLAFDVDPDDATRWTFRWLVRGPREIRVTPVDEFGIASIDEIRFRIDAAEDRPPIVAVTEPATDESVLPTAEVTVTLEARDDVGLANAGLIATRQEGGKATTTQVLDTTAPTRAKLERRSETVALEKLGAAPGDVVVFVAVADDVFELDGIRHARVTSAPRTLRIISEVELGKQIRQQLAGVRRAAMRLDAQQGELSAAAQNGRFDPALERGQAQVSERIRAAAEAVNELADRVSRNRLADEELAATLDTAKDLLESANRASSSASEAMQRKRDARSESDAARATTEAVAAQEDVRAELEDLVKLLDRDEDSWAMGREIDRLREAVANLAQRTKAVGERTVGQDPDEMKSADRGELDQIADAQREAAQSAQALLDELRKRAEAVDRVDKSRAEAMREAARAGEERRLQRNLEQAGDEVRANRMQQAQASQQQSMEALDRMRRGLDDVKKARAEELRRALESLEMSIERLVKTNEDEIIALAQVMGVEDEDGLTERSRAMARLAQNTQAVASEARAVGSEASRAARSLDRAADSHGGAVGFLRAKPARIADGQAAEERGLALLQEALESARQSRQQSEQREQAKKMQELVAAYAHILEKQLGLRDATLVARPKDPAAKLDRRGLIESRRLAIAQGEIGRSMQSMIDEHAELLKGSEIFVSAHAMVSDWASQASQRLGAGDLGEATVGLETQIVDAVGSLVDSLAQAAPDDNPFQENQAPGGNNNGGAGSSGSGGPKLPPVAELKLLRGLQVQVLERTKKLDAERATSVDAAAVDGELTSLAALQERLFGLLEKLLQQTEQKPAGAGQGPGDGAGPQPDGAGGTPPPVTPGFWTRADNGFARFR